MRNSRLGGFTLIELMIIVAILGILAAVALPTFSNLVAKSQEATTKSNLGVLRSALSIYYGDMEGHSTPDIACLTTAGRYLTRIPDAYLPKTPNNNGHATTNRVLQMTIGRFGIRLQTACGNGILAAQPIGDPMALVLTAHACDVRSGGIGGWLYNGVAPEAPTNGHIVVACSGEDLNGTEWDAN